MTTRWREGLRELMSSTFGLTRDERLMVALILALALLGLAVKAWHQHRLTERGAPPVEARP